MTLTPDGRIGPAPDVAWELLHDGGLMACPMAGGDLLELSAPAGALWTWLVEGASIDALGHRMAAELAVTSAEAEGQALAFCQALLERGLLSALRV